MTVLPEITDSRNIWHFNVCLLDGSPARESQDLFPFLCLQPGNKVIAGTEIILFQLIME